MSSLEYNDLFKKAQSCGLYHMYVFDIVGSKKMTSKVRSLAQMKLKQLMLNIYADIRQIENTSGCKILVFEKDFVQYSENYTLNGFGMKVEPFIFGDTFGFTIYRDTLNESIIKNFLIIILEN